MTAKTAQFNLKSLKSKALPFALPIITIVLVLVGGLVAYQRNFTKAGLSGGGSVTPTPTPLPANIIPLPKPDYRSSNSIEAVLKSRRTKRDLKADQLTLKQVSQMLWAAQGVTSDWGGRTTPSAKSTYPLNAYLIANHVEKLENGLYQYVPGDRVMAHQLVPLKLANFQDAIYDITKQSSSKEPAALILITGDMAKMAEAFGGTKHDEDVYLEAGHAAQNLYLQAESLKLGMVVTSSLDQNKLKNLLSIPVNETLIYLVPFGYPKE